jgi:bacteriorhodopsin
VYRRLWNGGLSTALGAAVLALASIPVARAVSGARTGTGTDWYVVGVELAGLGATGLMHLLIAFTVRPIRIFGQVMAAATGVAVLAPFAGATGLAWSTVTAALNLVLGLAVGILVAGTARAAMNAGTSSEADCR